MMMAYEHNSELIEWGLRFFDCNPVPSSGYCNGFTHYADKEQIFRNSSYRPDYRNIENDAVIANLLQADLSEVANSQPSGFSQSADYFPEPRSWYYCPPSHSVYSEYESDRTEMIDVEIGRSQSCLRTEEISYEDEEYTSSSMELISDSTFDEQVGRRLNQMIPVPHVPRINGELPTRDEATSDYERLRNRLEFCGLSEKNVQGDGNCQFRALSDQLYRSPEHHKLVRQQVVNQLQFNRKYYEGYVPMDYSDYLKKTLESGAWGDHVTLQAAADLYGVKIVVVTSFKDTYYIDILPKVRKSKRVLYLSFWAEVHYNSIYPQHQTDKDINMELAVTKSPKKKWWDFTSKRWELGTTVRLLRRPGSG